MERTLIFCGCPDVVAEAVELATDEEAEAELAACLAATSAGDMWWPVISAQYPPAWWAQTVKRHI